MENTTATIKAIINDYQLLTTLMVGFISSDCNRNLNEVEQNRKTLLELKQAAETLDPDDFDDEQKKSLDRMLNILEQGLSILAEDRKELTREKVARALIKKQTYPSLFAVEKESDRAKREALCIQALGRVLTEEFPRAYFHLDGYSEDAVCMEQKEDGSYEIFYGERNIHDTHVSYANMVEAGIDMIRRLALIDEQDRIIDKYLDAIICTRCFQTK